VPARYRTSSSAGRALAVVAATPLLLAACMGFGGSDKPPPATTVSAAPATAAVPANAAAAAADDGVALLDIFRRQMPAAAGLDKADDVYAERSAQLALEYASDGSSRPWTNPDTGTTGTVTPTRTYQTDGTYCREYSQTIQIRERGSKDVKATGEAKAGVACRRPDGKWAFKS